MKNFQILFVSLCLLGIISCDTTAQNEEYQKIVKKEYTGEKIEKTDVEWKAELTTDQYTVLRKEGTEKPFSSKLLKNKEKGIYQCVGCHLPLFSSASKFNSGTGWPSYYEPIVPENIKYIDDSSYGMTRIEVECPRCGGHLGHVFNDGPKPTGLRYCINGDALEFEPEK